MASRIDTLTDKWNELRNAALGRGLKPNVSEGMAVVVGRGFDAFRAWRAEYFKDEGVEVFDDAIGDADLTAQEKKFNATRLIVSTELKTGLPLPAEVGGYAEQVIEEAKEIAEKAGKGIGLGLGVALGGGLAFLAYKLASSRGGRR